MKPAITRISVPPGAAINGFLPGADFHDCYQLPLPASAKTQSALALYLDVVSRTPAWVDALMATRNRAVALVGLKNLGALAAVDRTKPLETYRVGDRVGIFKLLQLSDDEVILGDADKHLEVRLSVFRQRSAAGPAVAVSTVVHIHNLLGRLYMLAVVPVHKRIVPAMLRRWSPA